MTMKQIWLTFVAPPGSIRGKVDIGLTADVADN